MPELCPKVSAIHMSRPSLLLYPPGTSEWKGGAEGYGSHK